MDKFKKVFPFLAWLQDMSGARLRADIISGLTVALVLIPQSMAYAQLAGLPAYYGLYAAFLPPTIAALFGSSNQLATGPVAVVSLMTNTALAPLATAGSESYIAYAILLAFIVGMFQFFLGFLRLGLVVNLLSHPVVNGFTNAAAIIIATSQLSKLFGVYVDEAKHHYETVWRVIEAATNYVHLPTVGMAALSFAIMIGLKKINPKIPNVLVAVVVTTVLSWALGFEHNQNTDISMIESPRARAHIEEFNRVHGELEDKVNDRILMMKRLDKEAEEHGKESAQALSFEDDIAILCLEADQSKEDLVKLRADIRGMKFEAVKSPDGKTRFYERGKKPAGLKPVGSVWRLKVGDNPLKTEALKVTGGGAVVGEIPKGLPRVGIPKFDIKAMLSLLPVAIIISLLGFMEAISIAKAMAAKTGQRLDPNQELIGQGLANMIGSMSQSYAVSGSFSRSAVNLQAGAVSGLSSVISSLVVVLALLFFTPLLYFLPQATLAAIIMMAVAGLINTAGFIHAWRAQKYDGVIGVISFAATLVFAPHLDKGIMIGVVLSVGLYLLRNMRPEVAVLSLHSDKSFRNAEIHNLEECDHIAVIRYHGSLFFANVSYLESRIIERVNAMPHLKHILIVCNGMNEIDASGEEMLSLLVDRMRGGGYDISFSGFNDHVLHVLHRTHLYEKIGEDHLFRNVASAMEVIHISAHEGSHEEHCPLRVVLPAESNGTKPRPGKKNGGLNGKSKT